MYPKMTDLDARGEATPVQERLRAAAALFEQRNRQYGNNYLLIGETLAAMFPNGLRIETPVEWQRLFTLVMMVMKNTRYAQNIFRLEGHDDSLDDITVYAQMGAYVDHLVRADPAWQAHYRNRDQPLHQEKNPGSPMLSEPALSGVGVSERRVPRMDPVDPPPGRDEWRKD